MTNTRKEMKYETDPVHALLDLIISNRLNVLQKRGTLTNCVGFHLSSLFCFRTILNSFKYNTQFLSYDWEFPEITEDDTHFQLNIFTSSSQQRLLIESWEFEYDF